VHFQLTSSQGAISRACAQGFVALHISKDEWAAVDHTDSEDEGNEPGVRRRKPGYSRRDRASLLAAKLPLCLNRSLAQLKLGDTKAALWDADQALSLIPDEYTPLPAAAQRISPAAAGHGAAAAQQQRPRAEHAAAAPLAPTQIDFAGFHAKALYRRASARSAAIGAELAKEEARPRQYWDGDKALKWARLGIADALRAAEVLDQAGRAPDTGVGALRVTLERQRALVQRHLEGADKDWAALARQRLFAVESTKRAGSAVDSVAASPAAAAVSSAPAPADAAARTDPTPVDLTDLPDLEPA
jgi:hypothetical protein